MSQVHILKADASELSLPALSEVQGSVSIDRGIANLENGKVILLGAIVGTLNELSKVLKSRETRLNDPHENGTGEDTVSPDGQDYADLLADVEFALNRIGIR